MNEHETSTHEPESQGGDTSSNRALFSRVLVIVMFVWIGGFGLMALYQSLQSDPELKTLVSPFKLWDGEWLGEITVTGPDGAVVTRTAQRREYKHVLADKDFRQEGHFYEKDVKSGGEELERQLNTMDFRFRVLKRKAMRKNGTQTIDYAGEIKDGKIVWSHNVPGASFVLREWVEGDEMHIEGTETAGDPARGAQTLTVAGFFRRVKSADGKPVDAPPAILDNDGAKSNDAKTTLSEVAK